jgi:hypothetical protein
VAGIDSVGFEARPAVMVAYPGTSAVAAVTAAHEAGHAFGLVHDTDPNSLMHGGTIRAGVTLTSADGLEIRATLAAL